MNKEELKYVFGTIIILSMVGLQAVAWYFNKDGAISTLVGLVIGGIAGTMFGFTISKKKE